MGEIAQFPQASCEPTPSSQALDAALSGATSRLEDGGHTLVGGLAHEVRQALGRRRHELSSALTPASRNGIERAILEMFLGFPSLRSMSTTDAQATVLAYVVALTDVPLWAVRKACNAVSRGAVPGLNRDFAPSAPRLREIADAVVDPYRGELQKIRLVLDARPEATVDNEERKRVAAKVIALARDMRMQRASESPRTPKWNPTPADMLMLEHGISREAWDAIPDAPSRR